MERKMKEIVSRIIPLVTEITFKSVTNDEELYTSGLLDSMGTIDLALMLESEFGIAIDTRDIIVENFDSVSKLAVYINTKLPK